MMKEKRASVLKGADEETGLLGFVVVLVIVLFSLLHIIKICPPGRSRHHP
jgi:hypothetical protein